MLDLPVIAQYRTPAGARAEIQLTNRELNAGYHYRRIQSVNTVACGDSNIGKYIPGADEERTEAFRIFEATHPRECAMSS